MDEMKIDNSSYILLMPLVAHYRKELISEISKLGVDLTIASDFNPNSNISILKENELKKLHSEIKLKHLRTYNIFGKLYFQRGIIKTLIQKRGVNLIAVCNVYNLSMWIVLLLKKILGVNVRIWTHGNLCDKRNLKYRIKNFMYSLSDHIIFYEKRSEQFFKYDFPNHSTSVCYNSFNYYKFKELRKRTYGNNEEVYFCFVGRLTSQKSLNLIIEALNILQNEKNLDIGFKFLGSGDEENVLRALSDKYKLRNIEFLNASYDPSRIHEICKLSKGMVSPGNVGLSAITAISCGIPVITHNNLCNQMPEVGSLMEGITGHFFNENDYLELSKIMEKQLFSKGYSEDQFYQILDTYYNPIFQSKVLIQADVSIS